MSVVRIPTPLRSYTDGKAEVQVAGSTVREVLSGLEAQAPGIGAKLLDAEGAVRRYVNIFVDDEDIRFLQGVDTPVTDASKVSLIPAIAGGR
ncbi:MAG TPA: MoaD/ThiS family protein [Myxococcaceae bacterium]|nr:MoaD/ThiS family protein [Myxococcaceae bacterium]